MGLWLPRSFQSDMATLHDGGIQETPRTHLIARGFISSNPDEMIQIIKFIGTKGNHGISENSQSLEALNIAISKAGMPDRSPYILVTRQMGNWFTTMAKLGLFNTGDRTISFKSSSEWFPLLSI